MSMKNVFSSLFGKKKKTADSSQPTLVDQIRASMNLLVQKSSSLNDSWQAEKEILLSLEETVGKFSVQEEISSAKFEQDILGKITSVSSACDGVISGRKDVDFHAQVEGLQNLVRQRNGMERSR